MKKFLKMWKKRSMSAEHKFHRQTLAIIVSAILILGLSMAFGTFDNLKPAKEEATESPLDNQLALESASKTEEFFTSLTDLESVRVVNDAHYNKGFSEIRIVFEGYNPENDSYETLSMKDGDGNHIDYRNNPYWENLASANPGRRYRVVKRIASSINNVLIQSDINLFPDSSFLFVESEAKKCGSDEPLFKKIITVTKSVYEKTKEGDIFVLESYNPREWKLEE